MQGISNSCTSCLPVWFQDSSHYLIEKITAVIYPIFQVLKNLFFLCCCNRPSTDGTPNISQASSIPISPRLKKKDQFSSAEKPPSLDASFATPPKSTLRFSAQQNGDEEALTPYPFPPYVGDPTGQRMADLSQDERSLSPPIEKDAIDPHTHTAHAANKFGICHLCSTDHPNLYKQDTVLDLQAIRTANNSSRSPSEKSSSPFSQEGTPRSNPLNPSYAIGTLPPSDSLSPEDVEIITDEPIDAIFGNSDTLDDLTPIAVVDPEKDLTRLPLEREETGTSEISAGASLVDLNSPMVRSTITTLSEDAASLVEQMIKEKSTLRRSFSGTAGSPPEKHPARGDLYTRIEDPISALAHILSNEELFSLLISSKNNWTKFKEILDAQLNPIINQQVLEEIATILSEYLEPEERSVRECLKGHIGIIFRESNRGTALFEFIRHYKDKKAG